MSLLGIKKPHSNEYGFLNRIILIIESWLSGFPDSQQPDIYFPIQPAIVSPDIPDILIQHTPSLHSRFFELV